VANTCAVIIRIILAFNTTENLGSLQSPPPQTLLPPIRRINRNDVAGDPPGAQKKLPCTSAEPLGIVQTHSRRIKINRALPVRKSLQQNIWFPFEKRDRMQGTLTRDLAHAPGQTYARLQESAYGGTSRRKRTTPALCGEIRKIRRRGVSIRCEQVTQ